MQVRLEQGVEGEAEEEECLLLKRVLVEVLVLVLVTLCPDARAPDDVRVVVVGVAVDDTLLKEAPSAPPPPGDTGDARARVVRLRKTGLRAGPAASAERSRRVLVWERERVRYMVALVMGGGAGLDGPAWGDVGAGWRSTGRDAHELGMASKGERMAVPKPALELGLVLGRLTRAGRNM